MTRRNFSLTNGGERGFSLIEVLIAILVLALGLLGMAMLQTLNLRYSTGANERTQATNLAYDLLDQMRANRMSAAEYENASFEAGSISDGMCTRPTGAEVPISGAGSVIERWQCEVVAALGENASAQVTFETTGVTEVVLSWRDDRLEDPATTFAVETRL